MVHVCFQLEHFLRRADRFLSEFGFHEEREKTLLRTIQVLVSFAHFVIVLQLSALFLAQFTLKLLNITFLYI